LYENRSILRDLGLRPVINAAGPRTLFGGARLSPGVVAAMVEVSALQLDLLELNRLVNARLAELTRNEDAMVCGGAAAGLLLAVAAAIAADPVDLERLPGRPPRRCEIAVHRGHRMPLDRAVELTGARVVEFGNSIKTRPEELLAVLGDATAAILYYEGDHYRRAAIELAEVVAIAHERGIPVIVDAANELPPVSNLWHFSRDLGVDLVLFSGSKDLSGPQSSGLIVGRRDLVERARRAAFPNPQVGRLAKAGKEDLVGFLVAVEEYLAADHSGRLARAKQTVEGWRETLDGYDGVRTRVYEGESFPQLIFEPVAPCTIDSMALDDQLRAGEPSIAVGVKQGTNLVMITSPSLGEGEAGIVIDRIAALLEKHGAVRKADA
jgi:D-glucosaminate-6-phosphate ammonia-lyase